MNEVKSQSYISNLQNEDQISANRIMRKFYVTLASASEYWVGDQYYEPASKERCNDENQMRALLSLHYKHH